MKLPHRTVTNKPEDQGFTLIELILVVAIIGILAGILLSVIDFEEYNRQARDARRVNDILSIQTAISSAVAEGTIQLKSTENCGVCDSINGSDDVDGTGWITFINVKGRGLKDTLSILPSDPKNKEPFKFEYYSDGSRFEVNARLESKKYQINALKDGGNDPEVYERGWDLELK
jgi:prepilin-type N-terminal cleavage/methylation domain-containing protein